METLSASEALKYIEQNAGKHKLSCLDIDASGFSFENGEKKITDITFINGRMNISTIIIVKSGGDRFFKFTDIGTPDYMKGTAKHISSEFLDETHYYFYITKENLDAWMEYVRRIKALYFHI